MAKNDNKFKIHFALAHDGFATASLIFQVFLFSLFLGTCTYSPFDGVKNSAEMWFYVKDIFYMSICGFGFLMAFLRKAGFQATGYTLWVTAFVVQWGVLLAGFFENVEEKHEDRHHHFSDIHLSVRLMLEGVFAAITVLISFGAVVGVANPLQLLVMAVVETMVYMLNLWICYSRLKIFDVGGSFVIHTFGACFGLCASAVFSPADLAERSKEAKSTPTSDVIAMLGTFVLWINWPSFNSAIADPAHAHVAVINTLLGLCAGTVVTFAWSKIIEGGYRVTAEDAIQEDLATRFDMVHIQNSTLAGAVAIGAIADMYVRPGWAVLIGMLASFVSVNGYVFLTPFLAGRFGVGDTCGIANLHFMPGVIGSVASAVLAHAARDSNYPAGGLRARFPRKAALDQARMQWAGLFVTLALAAAGGIVTGYLMRLACPHNKGQFYQDKSDWVVNKPLLPKLARKDRDEDDSVDSGEHDRRFLADLERTVKAVKSGFDEMRGAGQGGGKVVVEEKPALVAVAVAPPKAVAAGSESSSSSGSGSSSGSSYSSSS
jgi:ammonium transporter Rh